VYRPGPVRAPGPQLQVLAEPSRVAGFRRQARRARFGAGAHGRGEQRPQVPRIGRQVADQGRSPRIQGTREVAPGQPGVDLDPGERVQALALRLHAGRQRTQFVQHPFGRFLVSSGHGDLGADHERPEASQRR
jgi:hypothetical protein